MNLTQRYFGHLKTITSHKLMVGKLCFKCGLYYQGFMHDWSKYSFEEFFSGVKYFQGYRSPISAEKEAIGYSKAFMHHHGRNKHHWEYWCDMVLKEDKVHVFPMPDNYVIESVLDRIAASKIYKKQDYNVNYPYEFFMKSHEITLMNSDTKEKISKLLLYLKENGEEKALKYYSELYRQFKKNGHFEI